MTDIQKGPFLRVVSGGQTTSLQDRGRFGFQDKGVPPSGVLNQNAMKIVNKLVGNNIEEAVLEIFLSGPILEVNAKNALVSLIGSNSSSLEIINRNVKIRPGRSIKVFEKDIIKINSGNENLISLFSISGGFNVTKVLGSKSTNPSVIMGGFKGSFLEDNMNLPLNNNIHKYHESLIPKFKSHDQVRIFRVIIGPHVDKFTNDEINKFLSTSWKVTKDINRMGIKLTGNKINSIAGRDMLSDGNQIGSIQITLSGEPIVLLPDRGTIGGYPKIATIISSDLELIPSLKIGQKIRFESINIDEAKKINIEFERKTNKILSSIIKI